MYDGYKDLLAGDLCQQYTTPCVIFTGHPSLRCGGAVHLMQAWRNNPNNTVLFTGEVLSLI